MGEALTTHSSIYPSLFPCDLLKNANPNKCLTFRIGPYSDLITSMSHSDMTVGAIVFLDVC